MNDYEELVKKLKSREPCFPAPIEWEAADAIKALEADKEILWQSNQECLAKQVAAEERAERAEKVNKEWEASVVSVAQRQIIEAERLRMKAESDLADATKRGESLLNDIDKWKGKAVQAEQAECDMAEFVTRSDHWLEYWNGNENERAMADALLYILNDIRAFRDSIKEHHPALAARQEHERRGLRQPAFKTHI